MSALIESECEGEIELGSQAIHKAIEAGRISAVPEVRCSALFGWLCGRSQRSFRTFIYYAYRYWFGMRQAGLANPDVNSFVRTAITAYATGPHQTASSEEFALAAFRRLLACEAKILGLKDRESVQSAERAFRAGFRMATHREREFPESRNLGSGETRSALAATGCA